MIGHPEIDEFFAIEQAGDKYFLVELQSLHDAPNNWDGDTFKPETLEAFALIHDLEVPQVN